MTFQVDKKKGFDLRKSHLGKTKRVVVKVGSAVLTGENGLNLEVMENLAQEVSFLVKSGKEVILVSSGAVAAGNRLGAVPRVQGEGRQDHQARADRRQPDGR